MRSSLGGEVTENQELLYLMREATEEAVLQRVKFHGEVKRSEEQKLASGDHLVRNATSYPVFTGTDSDVK